MQVIIRRGARRLGGRFDPLNEGTRDPALLVEIDGRLLRVRETIVARDEPVRARDRYLEICTPIEGVADRLLVARRSAAARLEPFLNREAGSKRSVHVACDDVTVIGWPPAAWIGRAFQGHTSWVLLELDSRMLRVLTVDLQLRFANVDTLEQAVREFANSVSGLLAAAGVSDGSARRGRS